MPESPQPPWHSWAVSDVLGKLNTSGDGLSEAEVLRRREAHGLNRLKPPERRGSFLRFLSQFNNVLLYVLIASAVVTGILGEWVDTGVIIGVVFINALVGYIQEGKAEKALEAIRDMLSPQAIVKRGGFRHTIPAEQLVPGDIIILNSGERVPADLRLLEANSLGIQEAILTGESDAVEKSTAPVDEETMLGDRVSMAYAGTMVTHGTGIGIVIETGEGTEIGRISSLLTRVETLATPLLRQIAVFSQWLTAAILVLTAATFAFGYLIQDFTAKDMFMAAVGLAVAAIPEGLPPVMTITLAIGVARMARRNAIIRRLPAVETLGSVTVICSDKTGTLTRNEMTVQTVVTCRQIYTVTGSGYAPAGEFLIDGQPVPAGRQPDLAAAVQAAVLCNDAELREIEGEWRLHGNPTDGALLTVGMKADLDITLEQKSRPRTDLIPFESLHKFMATLHHDHEGHGYIYVKGAPERILTMCQFQMTNGEREPIDPDYWLEQINNLASKGQRVIAIATRSSDPEHLNLGFADVESGLAMRAIFGLIDPPREEAVEAVARCQRAGIKVKIITGDLAATGQAIAARFGLGIGREAISGKALDEMNDEDLARVAEDAELFSRATPEHKLRLVCALQSAGHVVAMTGDGVNDAPALKRADIGIAMGHKGTEVAKEASEMVLADDNFASIMHAVEEGRTVYDNLKKSILFLLPTSGGEALTILAAILFAHALPITPVQILWVNMITAVTLGLALAFEPAERGIMERPPRPPDAPILSAFFVWRIVFVSLLLLAGTYGLFEWELFNGASLETARTVAVNALVAGEIVYLINCRRIYEQSWTFEGIFGSWPVLVAISLVAVFQILFTYLPVMQTLFQTDPIGLDSWSRIIVVAVGIFLVVEIEKWLGRLFRSLKAA